MSTASSDNLRNPQPSTVPLPRDGIYRSASPPRITASMAHTPRRPSDFPGVVVGTPSRSLPHAHEYLAARLVPDAPSALDVARILNELNACYVLVGGHAIGCWSESVRPTLDVDVIVFMRDLGRSCSAIAMRYPQLVQESYDAVVRFTRPQSDGALDAVDVIRSSELVTLSALENRVPLIMDSCAIQIPCPESLIALKVSAIRSANRDADDRAQDARDVTHISARQPLREDLLEAFSLLLKENDSALLLDAVLAARKGQDVVEVSRR